MRRILQVSILGLAAGVVNACKPEEVITTTTPPTAGIRFVHAVPDTGIMDLRAVDGVDFSEHHGVAFRSATGAFYKNATAGSRHYKVFMSVGTFDQTLTAEQQQAIASTVMADVTVDLEAGHRYTFIMWGFARTGSSPAMKMTVLDDNPDDPGAQVALRLVNAASGLGAIDGRQYPASGTAPASASWSGVAELTASGYVTAPTGSIKYNVTNAGTATTLFTDATALAGSAATVDLEALPGTTVAGSAVSGFVFPRSVAGSKAASFTTPGITFWWDRRPPRAPGL